jgi:hypothetical protein
MKKRSIFWLVKFVLNNARKDSCSGHRYKPFFVEHSAGSIKYHKTCEHCGHKINGMTHDEYLKTKIKYHRDIADEIEADL